MILSLALEAGYHERQVQVHRITKKGIADLSCEIMGMSYDSELCIGQWAWLKA
jgi:hypothetical protein